MKAFFEKHKRVLLWLSVAIAVVIVATAITFITLNIVKNNDIKKINIDIEAVYTSFENADETEKYNILIDFVADSESYSKYEQSEEVYKNRISQMKDYFINSYETAIEEKTIVVSEDTTKEELSTVINNLNEVKKTIENNEIIETESFITEIDGLITTYNTKIAEIEAAEKAAEEAAKKAEEERLKKEAEEKAKQEAAKKAAEAKNNTSNSNSNNTENSNSDSSTPVFNPNKPYRYHWDVDENGNEIPGTRTYDDYNGNVWDENYNYLGNIYYDSWEEMFDYDISDMFE